MASLTADDRRMWREVSELMARTGEGSWQYGRFFPMARSDTVTRALMDWANDPSRRAFIDRMATMSDADRQALTGEISAIIAPTASRAFNPDPASVYEGRVDAYVNNIRTSIFSAFAYARLTPSQIEGLVPLVGGMAESVQEQAGVVGDANKALITPGHGQ